MKPILILKKLKEEAQRKQYPSLPTHAIPRAKYSDKSTNGLTHCIIDYINLSGYFAERVNSMGTYVPAKKKATSLGNIIQKGYYRKSSGTLGTADIHAIGKNGRTIKIEVKYGKDRMRKAQLAYKKRIEESGAIYYVATCFDDFYYWWNTTNHV